MNGAIVENGYVDHERGLRFEGLGIYVVCEASYWCGGIKGIV